MKKKNMIVILICLSVLYVYADICSQFAASGVCGAGSERTVTCGRKSGDRCKKLFTDESVCTRKDDYSLNSNNRIEWYCKFIDDPNRWCNEVDYEDCYSKQLYVCEDRPIGSCWVLGGVEYVGKIEGGVEVTVYECAIKATGDPLITGTRIYAEGN